MSARNMSTQAKRLIDTRSTRVRRYIRADIPAIVKMCVDGIGGLPNYQGMNIDPKRIEWLLDQNINNDATLMFNVVVDINDNVVGCMCAVCSTMLFSQEKVTDDIFLFVQPEWRSKYNVTKLIEAYRLWGLSRKAVLIRLTHTSGYRQHLFDRYLVGQGFDYIGSLYHLRKDATR